MVNKVSKIIGEDKDLKTVAETVVKNEKTGQQFVLAIVGAPGAGKSTFSDALCRALNRDDVGAFEMLPMDGYYLDNAILNGHGAATLRAQSNGLVNADVVIHQSVLADICIKYKKEYPYVE